MFKEIMGLPAHALLVHAAVVFVPLLAIVAGAYAVVPRWRPRVGWAAAILAVAAVVAVFLAKQSGEQFQQVLVQKSYPPQILDKVAEHSRYAGDLFRWTVGLALVTGLLLVVTSRHPRARALPSWVGLALSALVIILAVVCAVYVYLTGDSGAQAVWKGVL